MEGTSSLPGDLLSARVPSLCNLRQHGAFSSCFEKILFVYGIYETHYRKVMYHSLFTYFTI